MTDCINMGGTANLFTVGEKSGIGAVTGAIDGASYGETTGAVKDLGNGDYESPGVHYFLDKDGSVIYTTGKTVMHMTPGAQFIYFNATYTVVTASGRFEGYGGTFTSHGWVRGGFGDGVSERAVGVARFEGQLHRK
jgi:hypothetical protein